VASGKPKSIEVTKDHIAMHQQFMRQMQQMTPPQEQTGMKGAEGNVPNAENAAPSQASLQAGVGGAGMQI
jgi:hypothetical protein